MRLKKTGMTQKVLISKTSVTTLRESLLFVLNKIQKQNHLNSDWLV